MKINFERKKGVTGRIKDKGQRSKDKGKR